MELSVDDRYAAWEAVVRRTMQRNGGGVTFADLDPEAVKKAYEDDVDPEQFATQRPFPTRARITRPTFEAWMGAVDTHLRSHCADIRVLDIDYRASYNAFMNKLDPVAFANIVIAQPANYLTQRLSSQGPIHGYIQNIPGQGQVFIQAVPVASNPEPPTNVGGIVAMWLSIPFQMIMPALFGPAAIWSSIVLGFVQLGVGISFSCSRNSTERTNGRVMVWLWVITFIFGMIWGAEMRRQALGG